MGLGEIEKSIIIFTKIIIIVSNIIIVPRDFAAVVKDDIIFKRHVVVPHSRAVISTACKEKGFTLVGKDHQCAVVQFFSKINRFIRILPASRKVNVLIKT